jgi:tRNA-splicing ligase RtcB
MEARRIGDVVWELEARDGMRVPGRIYATPALFEQAAHDRAIEQVANVAYLPGIVGVSLAMPDIHWGYGFPIGGVAATDVAAGGVVSPGGVGFDICCGVRLLTSSLTEAEFRRHAGRVMGELDARIPRGLGEGSIASGRLLNSVLERGAAAVLDAGFGTDADLERCEERGTSVGARPDLITRRALDRGGGQLGSLGAGNHFLEVQVVDRVEHAECALAFGLAEGTVCVMIHCGSRGLGHQTCTDHLEEMGRGMRRHGIEVPDRQLACVPVESEEGRRYLGAMAAAANFAWANRHVLAHEARVAFAAGGLGDPLPLVFDVAHNLAKLEDHDVDGRPTRLCVHRKGATRAFGPGHPDLPAGLSEAGQPVLVPGSMGTASWVLAGVPANPAWGSAAHGAGRVMSRKRAKATRRGADVQADLEAEGIAVRPGSIRLLSEEAPYAYKDVDEVVSVCDRAGLARPVARLRPLGVVKG